MNIAEIYYDGNLEALKQLSNTIAIKINEAEIGLLKKASNKEFIKEAFAKYLIGFTMCFCAKKNGTCCIAEVGNETEEWEWNSDYVKELFPGSIGDFLNYMQENTSDFDLQAYNEAEIYIKLDNGNVTFSDCDIEYLDDWCYEDHYSYDYKFEFLLDMCLEFLEKEREDMERRFKEALFDYIYNDKDFFKLAAKRGWARMNDVGCKTYREDIDKVEMFEEFSKEVLQTWINED